MMGRSLRVGRWHLFALIALAGVCATGWYTLVRGKPVLAAESPPQEGAKSARLVTVEVVQPSPGGIDRVCVQPGTVEPFESADLYAKTSGFLVEQTVDIGSRVTRGETLARISVPESEKQVLQDEADVVRADSRVDQMMAAITATEADLGAATAGVALAQAELSSKTSYRAYRQKQLDRIRALVSKMAIDEKLAEEHEDHFQAAVAAELAATGAIAAARQKEAAAAARVKQAKADLKYAQAEVTVAKARLAKSRVMLEYTVIKSPYTGVVTRRSFHVGDFVRSADAGGERTPVLAVERTDLMRVVVQVPDRDVPFVHPGNPAVVQIDALSGEVFKTAGEARVEVSRSAASEDPHTRMMRTEVDLPNPQGKLRRGMFGRVSLTLRSGSQAAVRIPSVALVGKAEGGKATVRVVRDDITQIVPVEYGADNGAEVEILSGLTLADQVVIRASGPVENGTTVRISTGH